MKIIHVTGNDDYAALRFEEWLMTKQISIDEIIEDYNKLVEESDEEDMLFSIEVKEFEGEQNNDLLNWVKTNMVDYDQGKHENFYYEGEII